MKKIWKGPIKGSRILTDGIENLPKESGVYIWKRCAPPAPQALIDSETFESWWENLLSTTLISTPELTVKRNSTDNKVAVRKDFFRIKSMTIGGNGDLSEKNKLALCNISKDEDKREKYFSWFSEAQNYHGSVLYVGEADSLNTRLWSHANGSSGLLDRFEELGLTLDHLHIFYLEMPGSSKKDRTFLEESLCYSLIAPLTYRPG